MESNEEERITELKRRAQEIAGGKMIHGGVGEIPPGIQEQFWRGVLALESANRWPLAQRLAEAGLELPPADRLDEPALKEKLAALIETLAGWRYYLMHTDHLADRELYALLCQEVFVRPELELPP